MLCLPKEREATGVLQLMPVTRHVVDADGGRHSKAHPPKQLGRQLYEVDRESDCVTPGYNLVSILLSVSMGSNKLFAPGYNF